MHYAFIIIIISTILFISLCVDSGSTLLAISPVLLTAKKGPIDGPEQAAAIADLKRIDSPYNEPGSDFDSDSDSDPNSPYNKWLSAFGSRSLNRVADSDSDSASASKMPSINNIPASALKPTFRSGIPSNMPIKDLVEVYIHHLKLGRFGYVLIAMLSNGTILIWFAVPSGFSIGQVLFQLLQSLPLGSTVILSKTLSKTRPLVNLITATGHIAGTSFNPKDTPFITTIIVMEHISLGSPHYFTM